MKKNSNILIRPAPVVVFCYENQRMNYCTVFNINSRKENCILFKTVWFYNHLPNLFDCVYLSTYLPINISIYLSIYLYNKSLCLYLYIFNCMYIYVSFTSPTCWTELTEIYKGTHRPKISHFLKSIFFLFKIWFIKNSTSNTWH